VINASADATAACSRQEWPLLQWVLCRCTGVGLAVGLPGQRQPESPQAV